MHKIIKESIDVKKKHIVIFKKTYEFERAATYFFLKTTMCVFLFQLISFIILCIKVYS